MTIQISEKFKPMFKPKRIKCYFGGRGGMKTVSFCKIALLLGAQKPMRFLCLREFMNSIDDSVHSALKTEIHNLGLASFYEIQVSKIVGINGTEFKYGQLARNITSIKSKHDFDVAWIEEAESVTDSSLDVLIPTIRKEGSEIWLSFNPGDEFGAVYSRFVLPYEEQIRANGHFQNDDLYVCRVGLEDNPWAPEELLSDSRQMKETNYKKWLHVYGGEPSRDYGDAIIQPEWVEAAIDAHKKLGFDAAGARCAGFDPADEGSDDKAVVIRHGSVVESVNRWPDGDIEDAIRRAFDLSFEARANYIVYDSIGVGTAVKVGLDQRTKGTMVKVQGFGGGDSVDNPDIKYANNRTNKDTFKNKRAQYWWLLADRFRKTYEAIEKQRYIDPDELISISSECGHIRELKSELVRVNRKRGNNSLIQLESKEDMRKRGVHSPNMADALVYAFANKVDTAENFQPIVFEGWG